MRNRFLCFVALLSIFCGLSASVSAKPTLVKALSAKRSTIDFGQLNIGSFTQEDAEVNNAAAYDLTLTSIRITGANASDFTLIMPLPTKVRAGEDEKISLRFAPTKVGNLTAILEITDNDSPDTLRILLIGQGEGKETKLSSMIKKIDFGKIQISSSSEASVTVKNGGTATARITSEWLGGASSVFSVVGTIPDSLTAGENRTLTFRYTPLKLGTDNISFRLQSQDDSLEIELEGEGISAPKPKLSSTTQEIDFGDVELSASKNSNVVIYNIGTTTALVSIEIIGASVSAFALVGTLPTLVKVGSSEQVFLRFSPENLGKTEAYLELRSQADTLKIKLTGKGIQKGKAVLTSYITTLNFGKIQIGTPKDSSFSVVNIGSSIATVSVELKQTTTSVFSPVSAPTLIPIGTSATYSFRFSPQNLGAFSAMAEIQYETDTLKIQLIGEGVDMRKPILSSAVKTIDFGEVQLHAEKDSSVAVQNIGNATAEITTEIIGSAAFTAFGIVPDSLQSWQTNQFSYKFSPSALGDFSATLQIISQVDTVKITLKGKGVDTRKPKLSASALTIDFGKTSVGESKSDEIIIENIGSTTAIISTDFTGASGIFSSETTFPDSVKIGIKAAFRVKFMPTVLGVSSATLAIHSQTETVTIRLVGEGMLPTLRTKTEVPALEANTGVRFALPILLRSFAPMEYRSFARTWKADIRFNATVLTPANSAERGVVQNGLHTVSVGGNLSPFSDTLGVITMIGMLGDAEFAPVEILNMRWFDANGNLLASENSFIAGVVHIADVWKYGGVRLVNPVKGQPFLSISPNPTNGEAMCQAANIQSGAELIIFDASGKSVLNLSAELSSSDSAKIPAGALFPGLYYVRLRSGNESLTRLLIVR